MENDNISKIVIDVASQIEKCGSATRGRMQRHHYDDKYDKITVDIFYDHYCPTSMSPGDENNVRKCFALKCEQYKDYISPEDASFEWIKNTNCYRVVFKVKKDQFCNAIINGKDIINLRCLSYINEMQNINAREGTILTRLQDLRHACEHLLEDIMLEQMKYKNVTDKIKSYNIFLKQMNESKERGESMRNAGHKRIMYLTSMIQRLENALDRCAFDEADQIIIAYEKSEGN